MIFFFLKGLSGDTTTPTLPLPLALHLFRCSGAIFLFQKPFNNVIPPYSSLNTQPTQCRPYLWRKCYMYIQGINVHASHPNLHIKHTANQHSPQYQFLFLINNIFLWFWKWLWQKVVSNEPKSVWEILLQLIICNTISYRAHIFRMTVHCN